MSEKKPQPYPSSRTPAVEEPTDLSRLQASRGQLQDADHVRLPGFQTQGRPGDCYDD